MGVRNRMAVRIPISTIVRSAVAEVKFDVAGDTGASQRTGALDGVLQGE